MVVTVVGAQPDKGQVILSLFTSPENFLKKPILKQSEFINKNGIAVFTLTGFKEGKYAVSAVYDKDNNGKLNTGLFGIPTELVGFSNNAKGTFGPPSFTDASFDFPQTQEIEIPLGKASD